MHYEKPSSLEGNPDIESVIPTQLQIEISRPDSICIQDDLLRIGKLSLIDEITQREFEDLRQNLIWCANHGLKQIEIDINSPGGEVFAGFALYDTIRKVARQHEIEINTIGTGHMASMASVLFQAGTKRLITSNTMSMIHETKTLRWGDTGTSQIEDEFRLLKRLQSKMIAIYCERSSLTREMIEERWARKDWWLDADEMLQLGLCDQIIDTRHSVPKVEVGVRDSEYTQTAPRLMNASRR